MNYDYCYDLLLMQFNAFYMFYKYIDNEKLLVNKINVYKTGYQFVCCMRCMCI